MRRTNTAVRVRVATAHVVVMREKWVCLFTESDEDMEAWKYETLCEDAAMDILDEILEAQSKSAVLGCKLNLPMRIVEGIHSHYSKPEDRLYHVIVKFLTQVEPRPTWKAILDALKSPVINLPRLAEKIEMNHSPAPAESAVQGKRTALHITWPGTFLVGSFTGATQGG